MRSVASAAIVAALWLLDIATLGIVSVSSPALDKFLAILATVGIVAFAVGQWSRGRRKREDDDRRRLQEALDTALKEIEAEKSRGDRLEREFTEIKGALREVTKERDVLRALVTGEAVSSAAKAEIEAIAGKVASVIEAAMGQIDTRLVQISRQLENPIR